MVPGRMECGPESRLFERLRCFTLKDIQGIHRFDDVFELVGSVPESLGQLVNLQEFDISSNSLRDDKSLHGELRNNTFSGCIPSQLCRLSKLQIFDVPQRNITLAFGPVASAPSPRIIATPPPSEATATAPALGPSTIADQSSPASTSPAIDKDTEWHNEKVSVVIKGTSFDHLSGNISNNIGQLKSIESLDLSDNQLFGAIPQSMATLTSINHHLYNNWSGRIPKGNQLQTLDDPSIYAGNLQLCGDPLQNKCPGDDDSVQPSTSNDREDEDHEEDKKEKILFYFSILAGYATGLWGVIGTLVFKGNWRLAYFRFVDSTKDGNCGGCSESGKAAEDHRRRVIHGAYWLDMQLVYGVLLGPWFSRGTGDSLISALLTAPKTVIVAVAVRVARLQRTTDEE
ncbi:hypothetical protein L484_001409 [Morus notabilis]|uniref:Uncharacterized protein n=1 Tax=Morus notabilis TaxID=981085 RepID=W9RR49_9ROSA|nr:hypothetical protein L484_001409 [Morus notabilis]